MVGCIPEVLTLRLTPILKYMHMPMARCHMSDMSYMTYKTFMTCMVLWHTPYVCMSIWVSKEALGPQECSKPSYVSYFLMVETLDILCVKMWCYKLSLFHQNTWVIWILWIFYNWCRSAKEYCCNVLHFAMLVKRLGSLILTSCSFLAAMISAEETLSLSMLSICLSVYHTFVHRYCLGVIKIFFVL